MISIGAVLGGGELAQSQIKRAISDITAFFSGAEDGDFGSLNIVFHVPGSLVKPDYVGVRTARFSKKQKMLMIQVAVPEELKELSDQMEFLLNSVRLGVKLARPVFARARIEYTAEAYLALVEQAAKRFKV
jgi:hypothetical protein